MIRLPGLARQQGAAAGSLYVAGAFAVSGVLTFVFHGLSGRYLGREGYGELGLLWSAVFLVVQVLWIGVSQTLGRYVAEREARGEDWRPVVLSTRRLQLLLIGAFLAASLAASPLLARFVFAGDYLLTAAFVAAVVAYAPEYFRRGTFGGHRQFARLGALHVAESSSRALLAAALLALGAGVSGPALAIVLAPLVGVLAVRPTPTGPAPDVGKPFSAGEAFRFAGPVIACVGFAQLLMNGGPILAGVLGASPGDVGLLVAALIVARVPQYVLSPAVAGLLPHASRALATRGVAGFDRFVARAAGAVALIGVLMVGGVWLLGGWAMRLFYGAGFEAERGLLVPLAALAAFYLLSETLNQALFALGRARLAALGWALGLPAFAACFLALDGDLLQRISLSLAFGAFSAAVTQAAFYLPARRRPPRAPSLRG